jgi:hypothetical protein
VAKLIQLYAFVDPNQFLDKGRQAGFVQGAPAGRGAGTKP